MYNNNNHIIIISLLVLLLLSLSIVIVIIMIIINLFNNARSFHTKVLHAKILGESSAGFPCLRRLTPYKWLWSVESRPPKSYNLSLHRGLRDTRVSRAPSVRSGQALERTAQARPNPCLPKTLLSQPSVHTSIEGPTQTIKHYSLIVSLAPKGVTRKG